MKRLFLAAILLSAPAAAHVTIDPPQAVAGSYLRAAFRVPHGCGAAATERLAVQFPEGVVMARPMPVAGWRIAIARAPLDPPVDNGHGGLIRERITGITWEGGPLPDEHYAEFVVMFRVPDRAGETLHLPVTQHCTGGATAAWVEIPQAGRRVTDYRYPAPTLRVLAPRPVGGN
jgi:periplasmic copper chaperone A